MIKPKECLQASVPKKLSSILFIILLSCSHNFDKLKHVSSDKILTQTIKLKINNKGETNKFTVYSQINKNKLEAVFEGIGTFNKHVFTLYITRNNYIFKEYINNSEDKGELEQFEMFPISTNLIFSKLNIENQQPIIIDNKKNGIHVEITIKEQEYN